MNIGIISEEPRTSRALQWWLSIGSKHQVTWTASSGMEAVDLCAGTTPHLILMDLRLAKMDILETTRRIMAKSPCAILIVSESVAANAALVFKAMGCGALDAVDMAAHDSQTPGATTISLLKKIDVLSRLVGETDRVPASVDRELPSATVGRSARLVAIGASAGGPAALSTILSGLPKDFPAAVVIVQHVDAKFAAGLSDWLGGFSALPVRIAREGDVPQAGTVLVAGTGDHLVLRSEDRLGYSPEPRQQVYRPSVDVFFESVCRKWNGEAIGVLLTGMGRDGALGLKALRDQGRYTIAQDEATSALYGMPKVAVALRAATAILPIDGIAARLTDVLTVGVSSRRPIIVS